jgi:hypothetical protein
VIAMLDVEEIRRALDTRTVLDFYGWKARRSADELESSACPQRSDHSRRAFVINANTGRWQCFPCSTSGDLLDFIAQNERLSIKGDFPTVLTKAAEIAGVEASDITAEERKRRRDEWRKERERQEAEARQQRREMEAAAVPTASAYWNDMPRAHERGIEYLAQRGISAHYCRGFVRFDPHHGGAPSLALHTSKGEVRNVVRRRPPELGEPKTPGLPECPTAGTLINSIRDVMLCGNRDVIITEGVFDSITAAIAWPKAIILGAHGAGNIPKIAKLAAREVAKIKRRLFFVPHEDRRGFESVLEAMQYVHDARLLVRDETVCIIKTGAKDLNAAWERGWRP